MTVEIKILDITSPTFAEDFNAALGLTPGESVVFQGPQFHRTDGRKVETRPEVLRSPLFWQQLRTVPRSWLVRLGCQAWDDETPPLMLFPYEWYDFIPVGYELECIDGSIAPFSDETDDDMRFGALAYGIRAAE